MASTTANDNKGEAGRLERDSIDLESREDVSTPESRSSPILSPDSRPLTRTNSLNRPGTNVRSHVRSASLNPSAAQKQRNRLSLSFPVNPPGVTSPRYANSSAASPLSPPVAGIPVTPVNVDPSDSSSFLTVLAAQERRVLELKEELSKAESELSRMQHLWAVHEGKRKRKEIALLESMRRSGESSGGNSVSASGDENHGRTEEQQQLREQIIRRKLAAQKAMNRRSFPGQKHTRALSLLSPQLQSPTGEQTTPRDESLSESTEPATARSSTSDTRPSRPLSLVEFPLPLIPKGNSQEALLRTGKQIAEDFKEGLWTFIEDLRQATVGEEAASDYPSPTSHPNSSNHLRRQSSKSSIRSHSSRSSRSAESRERNVVTSDGDFYESGWRDQRKARVPHSRHNSDAVKEVDEEEEGKVSTTRWSTSTVFSDAPSLVSDAGTRRTSGRSSISSVADAFENGNYSTGVGIPLWGFNIKKTANAILSTVEKTLAPPLPEEYSPPSEVRKRRTSGARISS